MYRADSHHRHGDGNSTLHCGHGDWNSTERTHLPRLEHSVLPWWTNELTIGPGLSWPSHCCHAATGKMAGKPDWQTEPATAQC